LNLWVKFFNRRTSLAVYEPDKVADKRALSGFSITVLSGPKAISMRWLPISAELYPCGVGEGTVGVDVVFVAVGVDVVFVAVGVGVAFGAVVAADFTGVAFLADMFVACVVFPEPKGLQVPEMIRVPMMNKIITAIPIIAGMTGFIPVLAGSGSGTGVNVMGESTCVINPGLTVISNILFPLIWGTPADWGDRVPAVYNPLSED